MSERYTLSNRNKDKPKSPASKATSAKAGSVMGLPNIPPVYWVALGVAAILITNVATYFITSALLSKKLSDTQAKTAELEKRLSQAETDLSNAKGTNSKSPSTDTSTVSQEARSKIQAIIDAKKFQDIASLLSQSVTFSTAGSNTSQQTPQQVIASLGALGGATGPWNWNVSPSLLTQLQQGSNAQYFGSNYIVGQSANGYIISVGVNSSGQITSIFISPTPQDAGVVQVTGEGSE